MDGIWVLVYVVIGAFVVAAKGYFAHVSTLAGVAETVIGILIWPLLLIGIEVQFR